MLFNQLLRLMSWLGEFFLALLFLALLAFGIALLTSPLRDLGIFVVGGGLWFVIAALRNRR